MALMSARRNQEVWLIKTAQGLELSQLEIRPLIPAMLGGLDCIVDPDGFLLSTRTQVGVYI
jgi:hypothetical protein